MNELLKGELDIVRVKETGEEGTVVMVFSFPYEAYEVEFGDGDFRTFKPDELEVLKSYTSSKEVYDD